MKELEPGFPKFKVPKKKTGYLKKMSDRTKEKMPLRKQVLGEVHKEARGVCAAAYLAPGIPCSVIRDGDEVVPRSGGGSPYDKKNVASLCRKCHMVKSLEVKACEILSLYGVRRKNKHVPISESMLEEARETFRVAKERLNFG